MRNLGELDHSSLQTAVAVYFGSRQKQLGITVVVEQRVQVSKATFGCSTRPAGKYTSQL